MQPLSPTFGRIYDGLHNSQMLEKKASVASPEEALETLKQKATNDYYTFELAKTAGIEQLKSFLGTPFGKGLGYAAGAAIPTVAAGNMISNHATEQARNRALETGLGLAGVGASLYGLHRLTSSNKTAGEEEADVTDALQKLASVGYLDEMLEVACADKEASEDARNLAHEVRALNREFGVEILRNLVG